MRHVRNYLWLPIAVVLVPLLLGCSQGDSQRDVTYTFDNSAEGWTGDFTDFPAGDQDLYELKFEYTDLPDDLGGKGLMLSGRNASDDLFMYVKKEMTGLKPNANYLLRFTVAFATSAPAGAVGIGGSPGESVWVKVGAAGVDPVPVVESNGVDYLRMNVDKGNQNNDGANAIRIGNVAKPAGDDFETFEIKTLDNQNKPLEATTDKDGNLWVFVGTDSGFEGTTTIYYDSISVNLEELP